MAKIIIVESERRNWSRRAKTTLKSSNSGSKAVAQVTRRYLFEVDNAALRNTLKTEFSKPPNAIYPYESPNPKKFYCIVGPSFRRMNELVKAVKYKLGKSMPNGGGKLNFNQYLVHRGKNISAQIEISG